MIERGHINYSQSWPDLFRVIHDLPGVNEDVDGRDKHGHDDSELRAYAPPRCACYFENGGREKTLMAAR
jgi:hypothetical protein